MTKILEKIDGMLIRIIFEKIAQAVQGISGKNNFAIAKACIAINASIASAILFAALFLDFEHINFVYIILAVIGLIVWGSICQYEDAKRYGRICEDESANPRKNSRHYQAIRIVFLVSFVFMLFLIPPYMEILQNAQTVLLTYILFLGAFFYYTCAEYFLACTPNP